MCTISEEGWNLFARVLEEILNGHGYHLSSIDDHAQIHPEKIRRLQQSLKDPKSFPVLNVDELERVITAFHFNVHERMRLEAALLTTFIEAKLMDRIAPEAALQTAERILPVLEQALRDHRIHSCMVKGGLVFDETEPDRILESALMNIDHALIDLHMSHSADALTERIACAREAQAGFAAALTQLEEVAEPLKTSKTWQVWHQEAQNGSTLAQQRLLLLKTDQGFRPASLCADPG
jgi:hypothetical protein